MSTTNWEIKVFFDGDCPFCKREINWLKKKDPDGRVMAEDIAAPDFDPTPYGITKADCDRVIHGALPDGTIVRELEVIRRIYSAVGRGWMMAPTGWPILRWFFDRAYRLFAKNRIRLGGFFGGGKPCADDGACEVPERD